MSLFAFLPQILVQQRAGSRHTHQSQTVLGSILVPTHTQTPLQEIQQSNLASWYHSPAQPPSAGLESSLAQKGVVHKTVSSCPCQNSLQEPREHTSLWVRRHRGLNWCQSGSNLECTLNPSLAHYPTPTSAAATGFHPGAPPISHSDHAPGTTLWEPQHQEKLV